MEAVPDLGNFSLEASVAAGCPGLLTVIRSRRFLSSAAGVSLGWFRESKAIPCGLGWASLIR